jgi:hypothetical protein
MRFAVDQWIDEAGGPADEAGASADLTVRGYAQAQNLPTDPNALLSMMRPDIQATVRQAQSVYGSLAPAMGLAQTISSGGVPNEAAITAALAAGATFVGGPLAGAAMATASAIITGAEAVMRAFFDALGLYDHPVHVSMCGLIPTGSVPYGRDDPNWVHLETPSQFRTYTYGPAVGQAAFRSGSVQLDWGSDPAEGRRVNNQTNWLYLAESIVHPNDPQARPHPSDGRVFDLYFATLLLKDLEQWANCNPYIPPRQLLIAAYEAWNRAHSASSTRVYPPLNVYAPGAVWAQISLVSQVLGEQGDPDHGQRNPPIIVNEGPAVAIASHGPAPVARRAATLASSPAATVAVVGAGAVGAVMLFNPALAARLLRHIGVRL